VNSVTETKPKRQNRTVTVYLCNTLAEYQEMIATQQGIQELIWRVEIGDSLNWGHLADGRKAGCPRQLHFTHHDSYTRWAEPFDGTRSSVSMLRVRCLDCEAVFTIQPAFIVRYKRYDTDNTSHPSPAIEGYPKVRGAALLLAHPSRLFPCRIAGV